MRHPGGVHGQAGLPAARGAKAGGTRGPVRPPGGARGQGLPAALEGQAGLPAARGGWPASRQRAKLPALPPVIVIVFSEICDCEDVFF